MAAWGKALGLLLLLTTAAWAQGPSVRLGAVQDWVYDPRKPDAALQGPGLEVARAAFGVRGMEVDFQVLSQGQCLAQVRSGALPACVAVLRSTGMDETDLLWPLRPMFKVVPKIYALASKPAPRQAVRTRDLEGRRVAFNHGQSHGPEFDSNLRVQRLLAGSEQQAFLLLQRERADYAIALDFVARVLWLKQPQLEAQFRVVGWALPTEVYTVFSRRHPQGERLLQEFEAGLQQLAELGSLQSIENGWAAGF
ncbi:substrate-binding periplasmic protein [Inhella proteolytica]|uniref:Transporter substrate-binding domain-containing protein n=1 Tax=Inhella proteolytica TaxID=2795029 RepID=A0A931J8J7_9BURK|nr:transporter substrate-binding domain-containing protein [Inhella proteolytica]MBH9579539.1 transporter substrate-binding domain-containing protein [Inhella proteolytica]